MSDFSELNFKMRRVVDFYEDRNGNAEAWGINYSGLIKNDRLHKIPYTL